MADDKDEEITDPWAGLEAAGEEEPQDEFAYSFGGLADDASAPDAADDALEASDEPAAVIDESPGEADDGGLKELEVEAVVEDDIAGWLGEPAQAIDQAETLVAPEALPELEEVTDAQDAAVVAEADEEISYPMVPGAATDELSEMEQEAATLFISDGASAEPAAAMPIGGVATAAKPPKSKKKSAGGVLGPIIGGLLSLPIVFLILLGFLWGTGRDPIGMRSWLPSFMVPARQDGRAIAAATTTPTTAPPSLDDLASQESADGTPGVEQDGEGGAAIEPDVAESPDSEPSLPTPEITIDPVAMVNETATPDAEPPLVEPLDAASSDPPALDLSGIDAAVEAALASMDSVSSDQPGDAAARRRDLVAWYKDLARVGAELAMLEMVAADSGRPLAETPGSVAGLYEQLGAAGSLSGELKRLCRNWVDYAKRPADGVLLVGVLEAARQVGPFWYSTVSLEQVDGSVRPVSLISRRPPRADPGDRVAVAGVVFSEDTVWAADCGRLDAVAVGEDVPF